MKKTNIQYKDYKVVLTTRGKVDELYYFSEAEARDSARLVVQIFGKAPNRHYSEIRVVEADPLFELYRAVKHQVDCYHGDHGYSLPELWDIVRNGESKWHDTMKEMCIDDYRSDKARAYGYERWGLAYGKCD